MKKFITIVVLALTLTSCAAAQRALQQLSDNDSAPSTTEWRKRNPDDLRIPSTRYLYPTALDSELCNLPTSTDYNIPCNQILNPCYLDDLDRTTIYASGQYYCVAVDQFGLETVRVEDICLQVHPDWYGCQP